MPKPVLPLKLSLAFIAFLLTGSPATGEAVEQHVASADRVPIAYEVHGRGEPTLVLIHGWSCDRSYWSAQLAPLSARFRVVAVDLGGHGRSGTSRADWTIDSFGEDVAAVVEAAVPGDVVLVGHSMGGDVAVAAARRLEGRVRGIVWVDTYRRLGTVRSDEEIEDLLRPFRADFQGTTRAFVQSMFPEGADEALVRRVAEDMAAAPRQVGLSALQSSLRYGQTIAATIRDLRVPIVAINAEAPASDAASLQAHGVDLVTVDGVGHFVMMEDPARFNDLLGRIVAERLASRPVEGSR